VKNIAIVGASVGGLVAAAELRENGFGVTIFEAGRSVAGMYGKVETPFGVQELGMHVLYLTEQHHYHLCAIFGTDAFHTWTGPSVDLGAHHNFGKSFFGSVYPDLRGHNELDTMRLEVLANKSGIYAPTNGFEAVVSRFGAEAGRKVYAPILKKLWKTDAELLSADAIHCFYDLRRVVLWSKEEADRIKADPWLDKVVANPDQRQPVAGWRPNSNIMLATWASGCKPGWSEVVSGWKLARRPRYGMATFGWVIALWMRSFKHAS